MDSSLARIPPPGAYDIFGNPFKENGEFTVAEDGYMYLYFYNVRAGKKDIYMDLPEKKLVAENIESNDYVEVGTVRSGETYRFYITSGYPIIADQKMIIEMLMIKLPD